MSGEKVSFRRSWWQLIQLSRQPDRAALVLAVLHRLFEGTDPPGLTERLRPVYDAIVREIKVSEKQRNNICKRWQTPQSGMIPSTIPPEANQGACVPALDAPAPASGSANARQNTGRTRSLRKLQKKTDTKVSAKENVSFENMIPDHLLTDEFRKAWSNWEAHRREKRQRLTARSVVMQLKMLSGFSPPEAVRIIEQSIICGYTGLFPPKNAPVQKERDYTGV